MSFYKNYPNRKDWRKPYYGPKSIDTRCANKECYWCYKNKYHKHKKRIINIKQQLQNYENKEIS